MAVIRTLGLVNISGSTFIATDSLMISGLICVPVGDQILIIGVAPA